MTVLKQSTQIKVRIGPFVDKTDGVTPETGITLGAADQAEALKANGAATADISGATWAAVTGADGWYDLTLTTSHTDTVGELVIVVQDASESLPVFKTFQVVEEAVYVDNYAASAAGPSRTTALTALSQGVPTATPTLDVAIMYLYQQEVFAKLTVDSSGSPAVMSVFAPDESTVLYKQNGTDSASVFTRAEAITGA